MSLEEMLYCVWYDCLYFVFLLGAFAYTVDVYSQRCRFYFEYRGSWQLWSISFFLPWFFCFLIVPWLMTHFSLYHNIWQESGFLLLITLDRKIRYLCLVSTMLLKRVWNAMMLLVTWILIPWEHQVWKRCAYFYLHSI